MRKHYSAPTGTRKARWSPKNVDFGMKRGIWKKNAESGMKIQMTNGTSVTEADFGISK